MLLSQEIGYINKYYYMKCGYKNCDNEIDKMRPESKYCCRKHKNYAKTYRKRKEKMIEKIKQEELKKIESYKHLKEIFNNEKM